MYLLFIIMFLFLIIAPFLYFLYTFRSFPKGFIIIIGILHMISFIVLMIRFFMKPYSHIFHTLSSIILFYILLTIILSLFIILYQMILHHKDKEKNNKIMIILLIVSFIITGYGFYHHQDKQIKTYEIRIHKKSKLDQLNIGMISDFHLGTGSSLDDVEHLVETANQHHFDIMFLCGDLFDESTPTPLIGESLKQLSQIHTQYGIYAVSGNHEYIAHFIEEDPYLNNHIHYISQNYVCIDGILNIVGREDITSKRNETIDEICQGMNKNLPTIILDHNPKRYKEVTKYGDLQLSGHTHHGQAFPLSIITSLLYDNDYGLSQYQNMYLIVSSGYGSWGFPFRLMTDCELVQVKMTFVKN